jgi:hypothetical protein
MVDADRSLKQLLLRIGSNDRFVAVTKWCAVVVAVLQLLLAGLATWILIDLHVFGTPVKPLALLFATAFTGVQLTTLYFASTLRRNAPSSLWFLAATYFTELAILLAILGVAEVVNVDADALILQPGAILPPNEIMGRGWPIALSVLSFLLALFLATLPLPLVVLVLAAQNRLERPDSIARLN